MIVKGIVFVVAALIVAISVVAFAQFQAKSRTPRLTTDDVAPKTASPRVTPSGETAGGSINWQHSMTSALRQAKSSGGLVIVDIYTDWCGWCKRMDKDIYEAPAVVALNRKDVFLKYNAEDGGEGQAYARRMNVRGYPTTLILDSNGELLQTARGYVGSPQKFVSLVENSRAQ